MSIITKMLKQDAVYWGAAVNDGDGGQTFPTGVAITCRWTNVDGDVPDSRDLSEMSSHKIYVSQDVAIGGYLYLGDIADVDDGADSPLTTAGAIMIKGFRKMPNFKATEFLRGVSV